MQRRWMSFGFWCEFVSISMVLLLPLAKWTVWMAVLTMVLNRLMLTATIELQIRQEAARRQ